MDILISIFLPVSLGIIMFSLGLGLSTADFIRVIQQPRALAAGILAQVILIPVVALCLVTLFGLNGELAFGLMILSVCPGGVTSNILTKLVGGTLALSISLTGLISLLSVITVPILIVIWAAMFLPTNDMTVNVTTLAITMFAITAVPVGLGMLLRQRAPQCVIRIEQATTTLATLLFIVIVIGAIASSWDVLMSNLRTLAPISAIMVITLMAAGWLIAKTARLPVTDRAAIAMETGIQNSTLAITLAGILHTGPEALPAIALPAAMYAVMMYLGVIPGGLIMRRATQGSV